jgi:hypothetical protein
VQFIRDIAKRILPKRFIEWYRRRRALKHYLRALAYEIYDRGIRMELDDLEGRIAARRDGFYERLVKDVLERTELVLQELDRKIEGTGARQGSELRLLQAEVEGLRASLAALLASPSAESPVEAAPIRLAGQQLEQEPASADR